MGLRDQILAAADKDARKSAEACLKALIRAARAQKQRELVSALSSVSEEAIRLMTGSPEFLPKRLLLGLPQGVARALYDPLCKPHNGVFLNRAAIWVLALDALAGLESEVEGLRYANLIAQLGVAIDQSLLDAVKSSKPQVRVLESALQRMASAVSGLTAIVRRWCFLSSRSAIPFRFGC